LELLGGRTPKGEGDVRPAELVELGPGVDEIRAGENDLLRDLGGRLGLQNDVASAPEVQAEVEVEAGRLKSGRRRSAGERHRLERDQKRRDRDEEDPQEPYRVTQLHRPLSSAGNKKSPEAPRTIISAAPVRCQTTVGGHAGRARVRPGCLP